MMEVMPYVIAYLVIINIVAFVTMGIDKWKAKKKRWRIRERTLFAEAILGGSIGAFAGMYVFRHKTKHRKFVLGIPLILMVQIGFVIVVINY